MVRFTSLIFMLTPVSPERCLFINKKEKEIINHLKIFVLRNHDKDLNVYVVIYTSGYYIPRQCTPSGYTDTSSRAAVREIKRFVYVTHMLVTFPPWYTPMRQTSPYHTLSVIHVMYVRHVLYILMIWLSLRITYFPS